ncbi:hypothetical protein K504DRAFT_424390 [Pleomassaria siparia CBS 279.74]|uniref:Zn(2)-C6 fungal-type domain-containing protein n=1 Tax=Pleomassaria siparia CBS 279.74 TaxID=1314801 RepID=A0A6G1KL98_9PLEO|nr:hypothetical protein K504DRAFT_424390 [Pleomassaria siparia CBS 279.74]
MEYETTRRYSHNAPLGFPHYYFTDRNMPLSMSQVSRTDPRNCPLGGPVDGPRIRGSMGRDEGTMENAQSRRRIAVACARCRKRKIRCSGDPGNNSGCQNCKLAGVDMSHCQFHRVGSDDATQIIANRNIASNMAFMTNPNEMMPIYNAVSSPFYNRSVSANQYPQLDTKAVFPQAWTTISYSEDTSPVEAYTLDPPTTYMSSQNTMVNAYGDNYRWNQPVRKSSQAGPHAYMDQDSPLASSYSTHGLPYIQTNYRGAVGTEAQSPLNMASLHSALPQRPQPRQMQIPEMAAPPQRHLPVPLPSPAQTSRNVVDQLQDQRLRSAQIMGGSSLNATGSYARLPMAWGTHEPSLPDIQGNTSTDATSAELVSSTASSVPTSGTTDGVMGYMPAASAVDETVAESSPTSSQQQPLNFSNSTLLDTMPAPATATPYSNFREYSRATSSSTEQMSLLARQTSNSDIYSYSKQQSTGDPSNEASLVSGHQYTPLSQPQTQHVASLEGPRRETFGTRDVLHRASMTNLGRTY